MSDQQRMCNLRSDLCSLVNSSSRVASDVNHMAERFLVELTRLERLNETALKSLAATAKENSDLASVVENIADDRSKWERRFNDAFTDYCEADEQLRVAKRVAWACVALTTILFLAMIYGEYN